MRLRFVPFNWTVSDGCRESLGFLGSAWAQKGASDVIGRTGRSKLARPHKGYRLRFENTKYSVLKYNSCNLRGLCRIGNNLSVLL